MQLKETLTILVLMVLLFISQPREALADSGIGMQFGEPGTVGLSLRFHCTAVGAAWSFLDNGYLHVNIDQWALRKDVDKPVDWFAGYGVDVGIGNEWRVAARIPVGLIYEPSKEFEVFAQVAPGLKVLPDVTFYFGAAKGARYRF